MKNYGYIEPVILGSDYRFGGGHGLTTGKPILCEDRNWVPHLPVGEIQRRAIETSSCTEFATHNALEAITKAKFGVETDWSERYPSIGAGNSEYGNDPNKVAQWIRDNGAIPEALLPFTDQIQTWADYMQPNPLPKGLIKLGKKCGHTFWHEWVQADPEEMWHALQYSPLGVAVYAWLKQDDFYIKPSGVFDNHWTLVVGGVYSKSWLIFDSYVDDGVFFKEVAWDYQFKFVKLYAVEKKQLSWPFNWFCQVQ